MTQYSVSSLLVLLALLQGLAAQTLRHSFQFNGNYNDSVSTLYMVPHASGSVSGGLYIAPSPNTGPYVAGIPDSTWSNAAELALHIKFSTAEISNYRKIIDFSNSTFWDSWNC